MSVTVPSGYKQTKVGVIPEDWEEYKLKDILNLTLEPLKMEDEKEYELITVRRRFGGVDSRGLFKGKEILVKNQFYVRENNFVISKRQISHGACGLVPKELDGAIVSNEYNVFQPNIELLNQEFFNYYVRLPKFSQTFYNYSDGVHIEKLLFKTQSWLKQKIPFPPLKEQEKIAQILTTWDDAISKQETLIKVKKELKKGLMQKLLSGEVRFEGFDGEWEEVRLGDLALKMQSGGTPKATNKNFYTGNIPFVKVNDITKSGKFLLKTKASITEEALDSSSAWLVPENTIIYSMYASVGFVTINKVKVATSQAMINIIPNLKKVNLEYLYYYLMDFKKYIHRFIETGTQGNLNAQIVKKLPIKLPLKQEQQKIAQVLTTADKEIELLKEELEALKEQKRGLMQRLLSGVVRVNI